MPGGTEAASLSVVTGKSERRSAASFCPGGGELLHPNYYLYIFLSVTHNEYEVSCSIKCYGFSGAHF